jgi:formylglycine-generating enzyme required for sulfatase activity
MRKVIGVVLLGIASCGHGKQPSGGDASEPPIDAPDAMVLDAVAPSCRGLPRTCGPTRSESCCERPLVNGGTFARGYDVAGDGWYPSAAYEATVSNFRLDTYEVTVGRFRTFVEANQGTQANPPPADAGARPRLADSGWDPRWNESLAVDRAQLEHALELCAGPTTWTEIPRDGETLPINCVSWFEAMAFCAWDGGYLPTEAEWNYAAAGGSEQRAYPWSSPPPSLDIDGSRANYFCGLDCGVTTLLPVGARPAGDGKWGQSDLSGNLAEWTLDYYAPAYPSPCKDCANLTPSEGRIARGGEYTEFFSSQRTSVRRFGGFRFSNVGFRCAQSL